MWVGEWGIRSLVALVVVTGIVADSSVPQHQQPSNPRMRKGKGGNSTTHSTTYTVESLPWRSSWLAGLGKTFLKLWSQAKLSRVLPSSVSLNRDAAFVGALQFLIPMSSFLNSVANRASSADPLPQPRSLGKRRRFTNHVQHAQIPGYDPNNGIYKTDKVFGPLLSRLDAYLGSMGIVGLDCQKRVVCQLSSQRDMYSPLSDVVLEALRRMKRYERPGAYSAAVFRLYQLHWAGRKGVCEDFACGYGVRDKVNMERLRTWRHLAQRFNIQLQDS